MGELEESFRHIGCLFILVAPRVIFGLMGSKDKGKRETKKAPKPKPKVEPGRKREDTRLGGPPPK
jgi:hypothetical protein